MANDNVQVSITGREAELILQYGYPFPDQAGLFRKLSGKEGQHEVSIEKYWLGLIIGDLCRSIREVKNYELQEELDALCDFLEVSMK